MEGLSGDVLGLILGRVPDGEDRKACSKISTLWFEIEALTRTRVRVLDSAEIHHFLPRFPNLTALEVHETISDEALMFVAECCPNLRTLDLAATYILDLPDEFRDDGLEAVARGCPHLVRVSLKSRNVGDDGIIALQINSKELSVLELGPSCFISDKSLAAIGNMESISELYLQKCPLITDNGLNLLSSGPASRSLSVLTVASCDEITDGGVLRLKKMSGLEKLNLASCNVTDVGGLAVSALSNLKELTLSGLYISDKTLFAVVKGCRNLVVINLDGCDEISGEGVVSLASSLPLERIAISWADCHKFKPFHVNQIAKRCPSLKNLVLDRGLVASLSHLQRKKLSGLLDF